MFRGGNEIDGYKKAKACKDPYWLKQRFHLLPICVHCKQMCIQYCMPLFSRLAFLNRSLQCKHLFQSPWPVYGAYIMFSMQWQVNIIYICKLFITTVSIVCLSSRIVLKNSCFWDYQRKNVMSFPGLWLFVLLLPEGWNGFAFVQFLGRV